MSIIDASNRLDCLSVKIEVVSPISISLSETLKFKKDSTETTRIGSFLQYKYIEKSRTCFIKFELNQDNQESETLDECISRFNLNNSLGEFPYELDPE